MEILSIVIIEEPPPVAWRILNVKLLRPPKTMIRKEKNDKQNQEKKWQEKNNKQTIIKIWIRKKLSRTQADKQTG